jgi:glucose/arabinose dehydrogenase
MRDFATGWELNASQDRSHGRPTVVTFAPDGRLFMGNDTNGDIIWMAPFGLAPADQ